MKNNSKIIMIVEDDVIQLDILNHILIQMGYNTIQCENGQKAMDTLKSSKPDLILLDQNMPDMSGFQLLKEIKAKPEYSSIPVLMMSVDSTDESAILCISCGAEGFIRKPVKISELVLKIKNSINIKISKKEIEALTQKIQGKNNELAQKYSPELINILLGNQNYQSARAMCTFASILSIRLHGISALVYQIDSEQLQAIIDEALTNFTKMVYKHKGSVNIIVNDLIICTFGIPVVYDKDTVFALLCAEEIKKYESKLNEFVSQITPQKIEISTCITSGKLYHGVVSAMQRINHCIMGNPLTRAFNLEKLPDSEHDYIIIDSNTREVIQEYVEVSDVPHEQAGECFQPHELSRVNKIFHDKIYQITNLNKQYMPVDAVSDEGYQKL